MRKWSLKYWLLKWEIHRDETFLLEKAILKAISEGIEINAATECICMPQEKKGRIYLPPAEGGVDLKNLLALIVDDYPEVVTRWFNNSKKLYG